MSEFNTLDEVIDSVDSGRKVYWSNENYIVQKDLLGDYRIAFRPWAKNTGSVGLFHSDGAHSDYVASDFYTKGVQ